MKRDARFYFGNLISDVTRAANAAIDGDESRFQDSLFRAQKTLVYLRDAHRPEAYEEGLLLLRALAHAQVRGALSSFRTHLSTLAQYFALI